MFSHFAQGSGFMDFCNKAKKVDDVCIATSLLKNHCNIKLTNLPSVFSE